MHFQIGREVDVERMAFEADPTTGPLRPSGRPNDARSRCDARMGDEIATGFHKIRPEAFIEPPSGETARSHRHAAEHTAGVAPAGRGERHRITEVIGDSEQFESGLGDAADKLPAHAMTRIGAGFMERHRYIPPPESDSQREPGETSACNDNAFFQSRQPTIRTTPRQWQVSCTFQPLSASPRNRDNSPARNPARMLAGISWRVTRPTNGNAA